MEGGVLNMGEELLFNRGTLSMPIVKRKKNLKVKAREAAGIVASLRTQVKELEKQRDFLITWKADTCTGVDVEGTHVDVEFQGLDGDHVHAHKAILASKSNEFQTMFRSHTTQGKMIYNLDMPYEALKAFINFFYTGIVSFDIIVNHLSTLLNVAHKYNVPFLANVCEDMLVKRMTKDNVISTFDIVKEHCSRNCKDVVLEKASRLGDLSRFKEYNVFTQSNPGLLLELYEQLTNQSEQSPSKKQKLSQDNVKSETDEVESIDDEVRIETNPMARPYMQINGVSQYGTPMYWHGTPILSHPFHPIGFDSASYPHPQGQRPPSYDVPIMPRSPYDIPSFVPPMFLRGFLKGANIPSPGPPKTPFSEEMFSCKSTANRQEDIKRSKLPQKQQKRCLLRGVKTTHNKNKKFIATITIKGQHIILGKCHTKEEAGRLYDRAAFVIGRKTNNELPDDTKEELKGISWDDFMASLQEVTALEKIHQEKLDSEDLNEVDYSEDQGEDQMQEQEQVLSDVSDHSSPAC